MLGLRAGGNDDEHLRSDWLARLAQEDDAEDAQGRGSHPIPRLVLATEFPPLARLPR
jgi:hypothetical protein